MSENINIDEDITASLAAMNMTVGDQIRELTNRLNDINEELQQQVREKHNALLQQAAHAGRFDEALHQLSKDVQRIRTTGYKLKQQIDEQYKLIANQTKVLSRLHELSHLLNSAKTLLTLTSKLKHTKDVLKQAEMHYQLTELIENTDLSQIEFVQSARTYVINRRQKIKNLTQMQLVTGLQERAEASVINALKIFMRLNTLDKCLENLNTTFVVNLDQSLKECYAGNDITVLNKTDSSKSLQNNNISVVKPSNVRGPGKTPQLTITQNFRAKFWKSMHWLIYDELYEYCAEVQFLKKALDVVTQIETLNEKETNIIQSVKKKFWTQVEILFKKYLTDSQGHISQTLQEGLSKLLSSIRGLEKRLSDEFLFPENFFEHLEAGYISKSASNMKASLTAATDLPNNENIDNFMMIVSNELSSALVDKRLSEATSAVFISCCKDLCTKLEAQIKLGADSIQVVNLPNVQQTQNTFLANILFYLKDSIKRMLRDLNEQLQNTKSTVKTLIEKSLNGIDLLIQSILEPIMDSMLSTIKIIILSIHREPGLNTDKISTTGPSMYMKELQEFIDRTWSSHLAPFHDKDIVTKCSHEVAKRCISFFIYNLCIVRPISCTGRERLKNDCSHMENILLPLCHSNNIFELGNSARLLRAMTFLIVQPIEELAKQNTGSDTLVPSYLILLLMFGHTNSELQSPHTTLNWSNERFIEWLDDHTNECEKLELIGGALQRYRDGVRRKKSEQYDTLYPLMIEFFHIISKNISIRNPIV